MKFTLHISVAVTLAVGFLSMDTSLGGQGDSTKFDAALRKEILKNNWRHILEVTVSGNEVRMIFQPEVQWTKNPQWDDSAKEEARECFQADFTALAADPHHHLHDYFHVVEYSMWSHEVIGEATMMRVDFPSTETADGKLLNPQSSDSGVPAMADIQSIKPDTEQSKVADLANDIFSVTNLKVGKYAYKIVAMDSKLNGDTSVTTMLLVGEGGVGVEAAYDVAFQLTPSEDGYDLDSASIEKDEIALTFRADGGTIKKFVHYDSISKTLKEKSGM